MSGLPPAFLDVGSAETFHDTNRIWPAGGHAELHVWPGCFPGFDATVPQAAISQEARAARVRRRTSSLGGMKGLAVRLAALDADAGAALPVFSYFDSLVESRAGPQSIVRGAAVPADCPARLSAIATPTQIRVLSGPLQQLPGRAGAGPAVAVADLPASWAAAKVALRGAADGTDEDPGP
jgi:hypothetical protein